MESNEKRMRGGEQVRPIEHLDKERPVCARTARAVRLVGLWWGQSSPAAPSPQRPRRSEACGRGPRRTEASPAANVWVPLLARCNAGRPRVTVEIQQTGSSLTAKVTKHSYGTSCTYTGSAGTTTIALTHAVLSGRKDEQHTVPQRRLARHGSRGGAIRRHNRWNWYGGDYEQTVEYVCERGPATATGPMVISSALGLRRGPFVD